MKYAAMTWTACKSPSIVITAALVGTILGWLWMPLLYGYLGIITINFANLFIQLVGGALFKGLARTRIEFRKAMQELKEEDEKREAELLADAKVAKAAFKAGLDGKSEEEFARELQQEQAKSWAKSDAPVVSASMDFDGTLKPGSAKLKLVKFNDNGDD